MTLTIVIKWDKGHIYNLKKEEGAGFLGIIKKISRRLLGERDEILNAKSFPDDDELVEAARQELLAAQSLFNQVREKELIDHAIYKMNAAERRYVFLIQEAQQHQLEKETTKEDSRNGG